MKKTLQNLRVILFLCLVGFLACSKEDSLKSSSKNLDKPAFKVVSKAVSQKRLASLKKRAAAIGRQAPLKEIDIKGPPDKMTVKDANISNQQLKDFAQTRKKIQRRQKSFQERTIQLITKRMALEKFKKISRAKPTELEKYAEADLKIFRSLSKKLKEKKASHQQEMAKFIRSNSKIPLARYYQISRILQLNEKTRARFENLVK